MAFDHDDDDERPPPTSPLPPEDRIWRHPSELGRNDARAPVWAPPAPAPARRAVLVLALASACVAGAAMAAGLLWAAQPTEEAEPPRGRASFAATTTASFSAPAATDQLRAEVAPSLTALEVERDGEWSTGTGIWLDDEGTFAVATPLVAGATSVAVRSERGRSAAIPMASDAATGITVLRIADPVGAPLQARAAEARSGDDVVAISATLDDDDPPVVLAAIHAVGVRTGADAWILHDALQLDRAVPQRSVGAVLVDAQGHVVGIVLATADADRLAVAVPAADALDAARQLRDHGEVRRGRLGVRATDATTTVEGVARPAGALLTEVEPSTPAAAAGLAPGHVVTALGDRTIRDASDLVVALQDHEPGDRVEVAWRDGDGQQRATVTLSD